MTEPILQPIETPAATATPTRAKSTIGFPYDDLNAAVRVAKALHDLGDRCGHDQLAPALKYSSVENGAYKLAVATARHCGLINVERDGVTLTALGHRIVDPGEEMRARADAFLAVPLYRKVFEDYKGRTLPSTNIGLENRLVEFGVAPKQKDKARQVLQRSAEQAGYFYQGRDRLVAPVFQGQHVKEDLAPPSDQMERGGGGGGGGGGGEYHPFIQGLLQTLPPANTEWSQADQQKWLDAAKTIFGLIYKAPTLQLPAANGTGYND